MIYSHVEETLSDFPLIHTQKKKRLNKIVILSDLQNKMENLYFLYYDCVCVFFFHSFDIFIISHKFY